MKKERNAERRRKAEHKRMTEGIKSVFRLKRLWLLALFPLSVLLLFLAGRSAYFAEVIYAQNIFKWISQGISAITGLLPFSLAEWLIILAPFAVLCAVAFWIAGMVRHRKEWKLRFAKGVINVLCAGCLVYFIYATGCGINY